VKATVLIAALVLSSLAPGLVMAADECSVPMTNWQPREAVEQLAKTHGWTVRRIKLDDGCYEIKGEDGNGRGIEVTVDPGSLAVIRVKYEHGKDDKDYKGGRGEQSGQGGVPAPTVAPPPNGLFENGTAPKVQVQ
jgi:hypothetical protein